MRRQCSIADSWLGPLCSSGPGALTSGPDRSALVEQALVDGRLRLAIAIAGVWYFSSPFPTASFKYDKIPGAAAAVIH